MQTERFVDSEYEQANKKVKIGQLGIWLGIPGEYRVNPVYGSVILGYMPDWVAARKKTLKIKKIAET